MGSEWRQSTWGEEISLEYGKGLRGYKDAEGPYRVYGSNGPVGWTSSPLAPGPGVILGRKGAYRGLEYSEAPFFVIDTAYYVKIKTDLHMRWLYYAINHYKLGEIDDGSPIPSTTRAAVYVRELQVPPSKEQRAIAHILGSLDDKIELNRQMNRTLEKMAQAIFKSWFIDFDPVRAKAEGRETGLPKDIADLFPDSFEDSELGPIPKGWMVKTIGEISQKISKGTTPRKKDVLAAPDNSSVPFLKVKNISDDGAIAINALERIPRSIHEGPLKRSMLKKRDVLFSIAGTIGRVTILPDDLDDANANQAIAFVRLNDSNITPDYVRLLFLSKRIQHEAKSKVVQGVQANVSLTVLSELLFVCPNSKLLAAWSQYTRTLFEKLSYLDDNTRTLQKARDTLLPKLISGELPILDAEKLLEDIQ